MTTYDDIRQAAAQRRRMTEDARYADEKLRKLVTDAMDAGLSPVEIAKAAGMSRPRIYQIRDGK